MDKGFLKQPISQLDLILKLGNLQIAEWLIIICKSP